MKGNEFGNEIFFTFRAVLLIDWSLFSLVVVGLFRFLAGEEGWNGVGRRGFRACVPFLWEEKKRYWVWIVKEERRSSESGWKWKIKVDSDPVID